MYQSGRQQIDNIIACDGFGVTQTTFARAGYVGKVTEDNDSAESLTPSTVMIA